MGRKNVAILIEMILSLAEVTMSGFGRTTVLPMTRFTTVHTAVFMVVFVFLFFGEFLELGVAKWKVGEINIGEIGVFVSSGTDIGMAARVYR
jgi:hypothetical protein